MSNDHLTGRRKRRLNRILLIHHDDTLRNFLLRGIPKDEFEIIVATDGNKGIAKLQDNTPDVVITAEDFPFMEGEELIHGIRQASDVPIIILGTTEGHLAGARLIDIGADAYIPRPLSLRDLVARIYSLLDRLSQPQSGPNQKKKKRRPFSTTKERSQRKTLATLTPTESRLLSCLKQHSGRVVPSSKLISEVWGEKPVRPDMLKVYVRRLRQKLGDDPVSPIYVINERGIGYRWGGNMETRNR